jgi:hypothetical protein
MSANASPSSSSSGYGSSLYRVTPTPPPPPPPPFNVEEFFQHDWPGQHGGGGNLWAAYAIQTPPAPVQDLFSSMGSPLTPQLTLDSTGMPVPGQRTPVRRRGYTPTEFTPGGRIMDLPPASPAPSVAFSWPATPRQQTPLFLPSPAVTPSGRSRAPSRSIGAPSRRQTPMPRPSPVPSLPEGLQRADLPGRRVDVNGGNFRWGAKRYFLTYAQVSFIVDWAYPTHTNLIYFRLVIVQWNSSRLF